MKSPTTSHSWFPHYRFSRQVDLHAPPGHHFAGCARICESAANPQPCIFLPKSQTLNLHEASLFHSRDRPSSTRPPGASSRAAPRPRRLPTPPPRGGGAGALRAVGRVLVGLMVNGRWSRCRLSIISPSKRGSAPRALRSET